MSKYRNSRGAEEDQELEEALKERQGNANPEGGDPESTSTSNEDEEGGNWKKRHGDLRRTSAKREKELQDRIDRLEKAVSEKKNEPIKFPADEEEFAAWVSKYPQMTKMMDTLVQRRILEGNKMLEPNFDRVSQLEQQLSSERSERQKEIALGQIKKAHPDFDKLVDDDNFQEWIGDQAQWVQDALWENDTDSRTAIDAIDLYKARNKGRTQASKQDEISNASAGRRGSSVSPTGGGDALYRESQVAKMSDTEYERHEDKIREAIRDGRFEYDLSM